MTGDATMKLTRQEIEEALAHLDECERNHELDAYRWQLESGLDSRQHHVSDEPSPRPNLRGCEDV